MRTEQEIREKLESIDEDWRNVCDIWDHGGSNPQLGAIAYTLQWVLEEHPEIDAVTEGGSE